MSMYPIPPDIHEKEKIIGGIFTLSQFIFIVIGAVVGISLGLVMFNATGNVVVMVCFLLLGALPFVPFGFVKIRSMGDIELFTYCKIRLKYKFSNKEFKNINENYKK